MKQGFSLIWVSVAIAVIGIMMAATLPGGPGTSDTERNALTRARMQKIEEATRAFMAANQRRPCPADATLAQSNQNFGAETSNAGTCSSANFTNSVTMTGTIATNTANAAVIGSLSSNTSYVFSGQYASGTGIATGARIASVDSSSQVTLDSKPTATGATTVTFYSAAAGAVPTKTLGLADEYAMDGFGRRIMYIVDPDATSADRCNALQSNRDPGALQISKLFTTNGNTTNGNTLVTDMGDVNGIAVGASVYGYTSAILADTTVSAVDDSDETNLQITLSQAASDTANALALGFLSTHENAMWSLISYGKDGHGAYPEQGGSNRFNAGNTSPFTWMNAFVNSSFTNNFTGKFITHEPISNGAAGFDDVLWIAEDTKNVCCLGAFCQLAATITLDTGYTSLNGLATGDINGDGIPDIVITANNTTDQKTYVIFGRKKGWPQTPLYQNLASDTSNVFTITNTAHPVNNALNIAVADVGTDKIDDLILPYDEGYAVIFGSSTLGSGGSITLNDAYLDGTAGSKLTAPAGYGLWVKIGDIDGNGCNDIIYTNSTQNAYIVSGRGTTCGSGFTTWSATLPADTTITNTAAGGFSGHGLAVGNVNDAPDDMVLQGGGVATNTAYVLFGRANWWAGGATFQTPTTAPGTLDMNAETGSGTSAISISSVPFAASNPPAFVNDTNNDSIPDLWLPSDSGLRAYYGAAGAGWAPASGTNATLTSSAGNAIAAGDLNNDMKEDILVSGSNIRTYFQPTTGISSASTWSLGGSDGFTLTDTSNRFSLSRAATADVNQDGIPDLIIATGADSENIVRVYAISGRYTIPWDTTVDVKTLP